MFLIPKRLLCSHKSCLYRVYIIGKFCDIIWKKDEQNHALISLSENNLKMKGQLQSVVYLILLFFKLVINTFQLNLLKEKHFFCSLF